MPHPRVYTTTGALRVARGGRGPDGTRVPPNTPAYSTAATTTVNSTATLLTALAAASSGNVIEVTANLTGDASLPSTSGSAGWATNVLIRPPVGQRLQVSNMFIDSPHVTVAGFDFVNGLHTSSGMRTRASRSGFWRCVDTVGIQKQMATASTSDVVDGFYVECVCPEWIFTGSSDHMRVGGSGNVVRPLFDGCYIAPKVFSTYASDWDIYTNPGTPVNFYQAGAVAAQNGLAVTTIAGGPYVFGPPDAAVIVWLDEGTTSAVTVTIKINGATWQTLTLNGSVSNRYQVARAVNRTWANGEVVTADISDAVDGLHIKVGVDAQAGPGANGPDLHGDTIQFFASGGKIIQDPVIRDSVIGAGNGKALQVANCSGEWVLDNCFIGRGPGGSAHSLGTVTSIMREHVLDTDFQLDITANQASIRPLFLRNRAGSYTTDHTLDTSNTTYTTPPLPACPDLTAVWPECPYAN